VAVKGDDELTRLSNDFNGMADRLQENMEELRQAARRQEEFTGAFAHELKTPLTAMIGYGQMLRTMELPEEERRMAADYIYREGKRLEQLSYKMLELIQLGEETVPRQSIPMQK
jgi:signal transduction histidine kinase